MAVYQLFYTWQEECSNFVNIKAKSMNDAIERFTDMVSDGEDVFDRDDGISRDVTDWDITGVDYWTED
jgi:hypothetical protein